MKTVLTVKKNWEKNVPSLPIEVPTISNFYGKI